jgi:hypothetical protein
MSNLLLLVYKPLLVFNLLSDIQIRRVFSIALASENRQLLSSAANILFRGKNGLKELNLLLFYSDVLLLHLLKLSDKPINFNSIISNLIQTFVF